ncbi:MAG TPA: hypothetical protein DF774_16125 [Rheinheimera sp.]|uniref:hypothetical protein n=1 Tax=Rheinheimera sp. TaxID=1869214 RepID=UPI000EECE489|nr:hypothetical protein [Rheinheimera sp.]HCU67277.1 hypothetical protein [Rheinheimera sp.]
MKISRLIKSLAFGAGLAVAFFSFASDDLSPYEQCILDCHQKSRICLAGGGPSTTCSSHLQLCKWGCGTPQ